MTTVKRLPYWKPALWGTGQIAVQVFRDVPSLLLLFYMTQILAIPAAMAGMAIFIPKLVWAVICDYAVGHLLDRFSARMQRRYFLLIGAVLAPMALILLFTPSEATTSFTRAIHVSLLLAFYMTSFATFSVPHLAIGTELSSDPDEQSKVMAWRTAFIGGGLLCGASLAPFLAQLGGGGTAGYQFMATIIGFVCSTALVLAFFGSKEEKAVISAPSLSTEIDDLESKSNWTAALQNRDFVLLFLAYFAQLVGQGTAYATLAYVVVYKLKFADPMNVLSISVLITGVSFMAVQPFIVKIVKRWGTRRTFMVGSALYAGALTAIALSPAQSVLSLALASIALGLTNGSTFQSAFARLSMVIADDTRNSPSGQSRAGFYSSLFVVNDKIAFAFGGTLIAGMMLSLFGFVPGGQTSQPESALLGITLAFAGVPILANGIAILLMSMSKADDINPTITMSEIPQAPLAVAAE